MNLDRRVLASVLAWVGLSAGGVARAVTTRDHPLAPAFATCETDFVSDAVTDLMITLGDQCREDHCLENIGLLVRELPEPEIADAYVLMLLPKGRLLGRATNRGHVTWDYHVVLERRGLIYDFDFERPGVGVPLSAYLTRMFGGPAVDDHFEYETYLSPIPASEFRRRFALFFPVGPLPRGLGRRLQAHLFGEPYLNTRWTPVFRLGEVYYADGWDHLRPVAFGE